MSGPPFRARGVTSAPANRFEALHIERDVERDGTEPTRFYRDASKTILAENDSPDVGFRYSLNPYRGCEHGCSYCVDPATPILHADLRWRPIGSAQPGDVLVGFDEYPEPGRTRKLRASVVEAVVWSRRPTLRLVTDHADVVTTAEHRWLPSRDVRWMRTEQLRPGQRLRHLPVVADEPIDDEYRAGYLTGLSQADPGFRLEVGWRIAVERHARTVANGPATRRPRHEIAVQSRRSLAAFRHAELDTRSWRRGYLAGFLDAEGHDGAPQIDAGTLERVQRVARSLGFTMAIEPRADAGSSVRLVGPLVERLRFFFTIRPAARQTRWSLFGREMTLAPDVVRAIEAGPVRDVVDIQTSSRTFIAGGLATHNCYARPSHEFLGFNAGIDFETRIMVKDDAPALLRRTLSSPRWVPQVVALSGNTDCYQPVERRLQLTRRCLEVFAEFRNPVGVITKSALVARDADLLGDLARHDAVQVALSVTTLDSELARRLEPRAAQPIKRLEAIATLADAGVPVAVMIGPVIPGLNDEEIPRILAAAVDAGARSASWVLLRLARPLDALFAEWLERNYPDRRERVFGRIRQTRDGRLNDGTFGRRQRGEGVHATQIASLFAVAARKHGLDRPLPPLSVSAFRRPPAPGDQLRLL